MTVFLHENFWGSQDLCFSTLAQKQNLNENRSRYVYLELCLGHPSLSLRLKPRFLISPAITTQTQTVFLWCACFPSTHNVLVSASIELSISLDLKYLLSMKIFWPPHTMASQNHRCCFCDSMEIRKTATVPSYSSSEVKCFQGIEIYPLRLVSKGAIDLIVF